MNRSMPVMKIDNPLRWRFWAHALAKTGVVRRRGPLPLALVKRPKSVSFTAVNVGPKLQHFVTSTMLSVHPAIRFAWHAHAHTHLSHSFSRNEGQLSAPAGVNAFLSRFETVHHQPSPGERVLRPAHTLFRNLVERTKRTEERSTVGTRYASLSRAERGALPEAVKRSSSEWWQPESAPRTRAMPASTPPVNLEQITNNVLSQLDQRIGAWRERMGRR
jgi:hypothetical protein